MDITEIIDTDFETFDRGTPVSKLRGAFESSGEKALVITDADGLVGVVTRRAVLSSHEKGTQKAQSVVRNVPTIDRHEDVRETARLMIAGDTRLLPVVDGDELVAVVRADDLLTHVHPYLSVLDVDDVATTAVVSVTPDTSLGAAIATFRDERIEHLPVVSEDSDEAVGIISLFDVLAFVTRELTRSQGGSPDGDDTDGAGTDRGGYGAREGESADLLSLPVRNVMVETLGTTMLDESLDAALETMFDFGASSSVVVDDDGSLAGIVTKTDLLESLTWTDDDQLHVQVFGADIVDNITDEYLATQIESVTRKYSGMRLLEAKVHFKEHKERLRGMSLIYVRVRLYTDKGLFVGTSEGYGGKHAFSLALNTVERQILEGKTHGKSMKPKETDELEKIYGWWLSE